MDKIINTLFERIVATLIKILCGLLVGTILLQILARYAMRFPFSWTEEFSRLVFIWFCMLSSTLTLKRGLHIGIDYLYNRLRVKTREKFDVVIHGLIFVFGLILFYYGIRLLITTMDQQTEILRWPSAVYFSSVPLVGFFYCLLSLHQIHTRIFAKERTLP